MKFTEHSKNPLAKYRKKIASQYGEDGVIEEVFSRIPAKGKRWCVEFGAGDGRDGSNVWNLITNKGWSAVLIEVSRPNFEELLKTYGNNKNVQCLELLVNFEGENTLDQIFSRTQIPESFDFLCIDIDGNDYHIWKSLVSYKPKVIMTEFNFRIPFDTEFVQPKDMNLKWGSSLLAFVNLAREKGYKLVYAHACNAIFVRDEYFNLFGIQDSSPEALCDNKRRNTRFFELYDGTIVLHGCNRHRLLSLKKKVSKEPVWILDDTGMHPVKFRRDNPSIRKAKNFIKSFGVYDSISPLIGKMYNRNEDERKREGEKKDNL